MPGNVTVVEADALEVDLIRLAGNPFHLVGNLPYNIATPLLKQFIAAREHILDVTIMLQKEVADRLRASAGSKDYGPLSLLIQYYATPIRGFTVPPGAFTPRPKVDSAVIRLEWKPGVPTLERLHGFRPAGVRIAPEEAGQQSGRLVSRPQPRGNRHDP